MQLDQHSTDRVIQDQATFDKKQLRQAFGAYLTGVCVVTALAGDRKPVGFTANSFTSVSLQPPILLVCPGHGMVCYDVFSTCKHFAVNILSEQQADIAHHFATYQGDRFAGLDWQMGAGDCPVIHGASCWFECSLFKRVHAGDHDVMLGTIEHLTNFSHAGLGYYRHKFFSSNNIANR